MEFKTARLTVLIDPNKKAAFERLCAQQDRTASQVVRQLIREYLAQHGVEYLVGESGELAADPSRSATAATPPRAKPGPRRNSPTAAKRHTGRRKP
jgi:hypothetical protein